MECHVVRGLVQVAVALRWKPIHNKQPSLACKLYLRGLKTSHGHHHQRLGFGHFEKNGAEKKMGSPWANYHDQPAEGTPNGGLGIHPT